MKNGRLPERLGRARNTRRNMVFAPLAALVAALTVACAAPAPPAGAAPAATSNQLVPCDVPVSARPTVVLVHGAWADASSWTGEVAALQQAGYVARAIANPLQNLTSDAALVADFLRTVPGPVVLVGHSYGGSVITNASAGNAQVKALVYVDAAVPDIGETTAQLSGSDSVLNGDPASLYDMVTYPEAPEGATDLYLKQDVFISAFGSDLPRDTAVRLWASQRAASTSAFMTPSQAAGWKTIPSWYFISTGDRIITPDSERSMAERAGSHITEFPGGSHLTLVSQPDAVTAVIGAAICSVH